MVEKCPYCREAVEEDERMICPACKTPHHPDCWHENAGCTIFGCENTPVEEPKVAVTEGDVSPPVADSTTAKYFLARGGEKSGPFSFNEVRERVRMGLCMGSDLCWKEGDREWTPVSRVLTMPIMEEFPTRPDVAEEKADPVAGVPRFGRRAYFAWLLGMLIVSKILMISELTIPVCMLAFLAGSVVITYKRIRDLGYVGWYMALFFVPVINILMGFHLLFSPRGYAITKKRDWVQITGIILYLGLFLLIVLAIALPSLSR